jgi:hypothetical protein
MADIGLTITGDSQGNREIKTQWGGNDTIAVSVHKQASLFTGRPEVKIFSGGDLLSRGLAPRVPSALEGLTSVFGMGTGVAPPRYPPETAEVGGKRLVVFKSADHYTLTATKLY